MCTKEEDPNWTFISDYSVQGQKRTLKVKYNRFGTV